jgi:SAM-dependent methyltransferase
MGQHAQLSRRFEAPYEYFVACVQDDPRLRGRILDVGCGEWPTGLITDHLMPLYSLAGDLDGIDPFPGAVSHPWLSRAWTGEFGLDSAVPDETYDAALAINVVDHISDPSDFLRGVFRVLRPGGVFYATTPSSRHPFAWSVRAIEALGLKKAAAARDDLANDYPAYYRCNSVATVTRAARDAGFANATFYNHPAVNWRQHLPRPARPVGWLYDELLGTRVRALAQQCMFRLDKPGTGAGPLANRVSKVRPLQSKATARQSVARKGTDAP